MAELVFHGQGGTASVFLADTLRLEFGEGTLAASGRPLASHAGGGWRIGDVRFSRITCDGPIELELRIGHAKKKFGPFTGLVLGSEAVWTSDAVLARYNRFNGTWFSDLDNYGKRIGLGERMTVTGRANHVSELRNVGP